MHKTLLSLAAAASLSAMMMSMITAPAAAACRVNSPCWHKCNATWQYTPRYRSAANCIADWSIANARGRDYARRLEQNNIRQRHFYNRRSK